MIRTFLKNYIINLGAIWFVASVLPALYISDGTLGLLKVAFVFMMINILLVPLIKILLLPLNLLTFGLFAWLANVLALYAMVVIIPTFKIMPFTYEGFQSGGFVIPMMILSTFQVAILASFLISLSVHFMHWLYTK